jgi:hypothetical protein
MLQKKLFRGVISFLTLTAWFSGMANAFAGDPIHINPDSLRARMIESNPSLISELNTVVQAKDMERLSISSLFPGASLTAGSPILPPLSFTFSAVSFLMPFLAPSNWFSFSASKQNFEADKLAYKILELNNYASIYSMYVNEIENENLEAVLDQEYKDWQQIYGSVQMERNFGGGATDEDVESAAAQMDSAHSALLKSQLNIVDIGAQLKYALGITDQDLVFDHEDVPVSQYESMPVDEAVELSVKIAPEAQQLEHLINAGKDARWGDAFSIFNGGISATAGNPYSGSGSIFPDLSTTTVKDTFPISLAALPAVSLDNDKIDAIRITLDLLNAGQRQTLDQAINGLKLAVQVLAADKKAETEATLVYDSEKLKYSMGASTMTVLLTDYNAAHALSMTRIQDQALVDNLRITLQRAMLEGEFALIPGCEPGAGDVQKKSNVFGSIWHGFEGIFTNAHAKQSLEEVCRSGQNNPAPTPSPSSSSQVVASSSVKKN